MQKLNKLEYYFSVDGETEETYLNWLKKTINTSSLSKQKVTFNISVQPDPLKYAKSVVLLNDDQCDNDTINKTKIYHVCDYESNEQIHVERFKTKLRRMKEANQLENKQVEYVLCYSNFTFELWILLHKNIFNGSKSFRTDYLIPINKAFNESFENLSHFKNNQNLTRILNKLTLDDVKEALSRAKTIMKNNVTNGLVEQQYCGYTYYKDNPSLSIHSIIEQILQESGLL